MTVAPEPKASPTGQPLLLFLGCLVFCFYALFTLMRDSHTFMVAFPWVLIAQLGFAIAVLWSVLEIWGRRGDRGLVWLGGGLDWYALGLIVTLCCSLITSPFPQSAFWYSLVTLAYLGTLYGLFHCFRCDPQKIQRFLGWQGVLSYLWILDSLSYWIARTVLPEWDRLEQLKQYGIQQTYDLSQLALRNWAPFGHPNYTAGFLLLALPLLAYLTLGDRGWRRYLWGSGVVLGLLAFLSANSRGGWLGLTGAILFLAVLLYRRSHLPRRWLNLGSLGMAATMVIWVLGNARLRSTFTGLLEGQDEAGEFTYRWITAYSGWHMGLAQPLTGMGLGTAPILYQRYRPHWAGQEAEMLFQLHSTPVQIWAELGVMGIALLLGVTVALIAMARRLWRPAVWQKMTREEHLLFYALTGGGLAYGLLLLTDYQADVIAISGFLVIDLAIFASLHHRHGRSAGHLNPSLQPAALGMVGVACVGGILWLIPTNEAWVYGAQGFQALERQNVPQFVENLTRAHQKAPWQAYYPYQLGWGLGEIMIWNNHPQTRKAFGDQAVSWFQQAIKESPAWEFGYSNLGWLLVLQDQPQAALPFLQKATEIIPGRRMVFFALGEAYLAAGQRSRAVNSFALEVVRFPETLGSGFWWQGPGRSVFNDVLARAEAIYSDLIAQTNAPPALQTWCHRGRAMVRWWRGDRAGAQQDVAMLPPTERDRLLTLIALDASPSGENSLNPAQNAIVNEAIAHRESWALMVGAWLYPQQRRSYFDQAWLYSQGHPVTAGDLNVLITSMNQAPTFGAWLRQYAPNRPIRIQRTGFNIVARNADGNTPKDFVTQSENLATSNFFNFLFPSAGYFPPLDQALVPYRQEAISPGDRLPRP